MVQSLDSRLGWLNENLRKNYQKNWGRHLLPNFFSIFNFFHNLFSSSQNFIFWNHSFTYNDVNVPYLILCHMTQTAPFQAWIMVHDPILRCSRKYWKCGRNKKTSSNRRSCKIISWRNDFQKTFEKSSLIAEQYEISYKDAAIFNIHAWIHLNINTVSYFESLSYLAIWSRLDV